MCGIAALFSSGAPIPESWIANMMALVKHRGPDDWGIKGFQPNAWLGHQRLSILDLSTSGHQPMATEDGRWWIIHNGEVYNYLELRKELEEEGEKFFSQTDTEVILKAIRRWGPAALDRFNGMFAFVVYDRQSNEVLVARDRFGVKPLYYWVNPQGVVAFASEIKQFTALPGWQARLNGQRAYDFLEWGLTDHESDGLFLGVNALRGGEFLRFTAGGPLPSPSRWYQLPERRFLGSFTEAAGEFRRLLQDAVSLRLRADVEVGSCLSGGLDSSAIVCLVNGLRQGSGQHTFSACTDYGPLDERPFMDAVTQKVRVQPHYVFPNDDELLEQWDHLIWTQDEPFGSSSIFAQWKVFELVRERGIKVMLDGQGADEQLGGYQKFFACRLRDLFTQGRWLSFAREAQESRRLQGLGWSPLLSHLCPGPLRAPLRRLLGKGGDSWWNLKALGACPLHPLKEEEGADFASLCRQQVARSNLPMLLRYEDRDSMAHSVESRTPFLDYRLVEFCLSLPADYRLAGGISKRVMREGLKEDLPEKVASRYSKIGFALPEELWFRQRPERFQRELSETIGLLGPAVLPQGRRQAQETLMGNVPYSPRLFRLLCLGRWIRRFEVVSERK